MGCSPSGFSVHGILQARILEWVATPFSRWFSQPRDQIWDSCTADSLLSEPPGKERNAPHWEQICKIRWRHLIEQLCSNLKQWNRPGLNKQRPVGQMWHVTCFCTTSLELRMIYIFKWWRKKNMLWHMKMSKHIISLDSCGSRVWEWLDWVFLTWDLSWSCS